jgi:hypothetical protein
MGYQKVTDYVAPEGHRFFRTRFMGAKQTQSMVRSFGTVSAPERFFHRPRGGTDTPRHPSTVTIREALGLIEKD